MDVGGPHSSTPDQNRWGSRSTAVRAAGLEQNYENDVDDDALLDELQRLASEVDRLRWFEDMAEHGASSPHTYLRRWGSWSDAKGAAGLHPETRTSRRESEAKLVDALQALADELGLSPSMVTLQFVVGVGEDSYGLL